MKRIRTANGSEMIELKTGQRLQFVARTAGSGRGFSADTVILDEAYELGDDQMAALLPTLSARPNPQIWYTSTAGKETSVQLGRVRERGIAGDDPSLAFFEWSADGGRRPGQPGGVGEGEPRDGHPHQRGLHPAGACRAVSGRVRRWNGWGSAGTRWTWPTRGR